MACSEMSGNPGTEALHKYRPIVSCDTRIVKFDDVLTTCCGGGGNNDENMKTKF